jgi:hypothetical protein
MTRTRRISRKIQFVAGLAIIIGGVAVGIIGYALVELQCHGSCQIPLLLGSLIGALIGSLGVGIVSVLTLRAMHEWVDHSAR